MAENEQEENEIDNLSSSFKILDNKKKINIESTVFSGINKSFALITVSDITKVKLFEKAKQGDRFKNMYF